MLAMCRELNRQRMTRNDAEKNQPYYRTTNHSMIYDGLIVFHLFWHQADRRGEEVGSAYLSLGITQKLFAQRKEKKNENIRP